MVEPMAIKVFGIMHVIFGCLGALQILAGVAGMVFGDGLARLQSGGDEQMYELQKRVADEMRLMSVLSLLIAGVVTFLILRAGI